MSVESEQMRLAENGAAIAAILTSHDAFDAISASPDGQSGGFPGIWMVCAEAAVAFTDVERELGDAIWEERDWTVCVRSMAHLLALALLRGGAYRPAIWRSVARWVITMGLRVEVSPAGAAGDPDGPLRVSVRAEL